MNGKDVPDSELFSRAMAGVTRANKDLNKNRVEHTSSRPAKPIIKKHRDSLLTDASSDDSFQTDDTHQSENVSFARSGLQSRVLKKLKRGEFRFQEILDLHGCRSHEVDEQLSAFLSSALFSNQTCVLIIHGKGYRSAGRKGVLKPLTINFLRNVAEVKAFCSALPQDGGSGAVYVLLKTRKQTNSG